MNRGREGVRRSRRAFDSACHVSTPPPSQPLRLGSQKAIRRERHTSAKANWRKDAEAQEALKTSISQVCPPRKACVHRRVYIGRPSTTFAHTPHPTMSRVPCPVSLGPHPGL